MMPYTSGPWQFRPRQDGLPGLAICSADNRAIATTARNGRPAEEEIANATIIAAAPAMLAALQAVSRNAALDTSWLEPVMAAISAAEGRA